MAGLWRMIFRGPNALRQGPGAAKGQSDPKTPRPRLVNLAARLRADFVAEVLVLLPLGVIGYVAWTAWQLVNQTLRPFIRAIIGPDGEVVSPALAALALLVLILAVGFLAKDMAGRRITTKIHRVIERIPVVGTLVGAVRQVAVRVVLSGVCAQERRDPSGHEGRRRGEAARHRRHRLSAGTGVRPRIFEDRSPAIFFSRYRCQVQTLA